MVLCVVCVCVVSDRVLVFNKGCFAPVAARLARCPEVGCAGR